MSLRERLAAGIAQSGPISVAQFMTACLHDPQFGYYATRPALGLHGDFITAPLVSQMFGELVGVWAAASWELMGRPERVRLVEMGPGDGTLMSDVLRAARLAPAFLAAAEVWLVEVSEPLKRAQRERLGEDVRWATSLSEVPAGAPMILIANELLDCLPARQFVRTATGWAEQVVGLDAKGELTFGLVPNFPSPFPSPFTGEGDHPQGGGGGETGRRASAAPSVTPFAGRATSPVATGEEQGLPDASVGAVLEVSAAQAALGAELGRRVASDGGAALLVDYGRARPGFGDTLQALKRHEKVDPLACPGEADLTVHADFPAVQAAARGEGAVTAILTQADFLARLGIGQRAEALVRARPDKGPVIGRQLDRLVSADQMGELFKACVIHSPGWTPPAFEET